MKHIKIAPVAGSFAENKDVAQELRLSRIVPALKAGEEVVLDFAGVEAATQSFIHALLSDLIRVYGVEVLDLLVFKNCNATVKKIIQIVIDYMQEGA